MNRELFSHLDPTHLHRPQKYHLIIRVVLHQSHLNCIYTVFRFSNHTPIQIYSIARDFWNNASPSGNISLEVGKQHPLLAYINQKIYSKAFSTILGMMPPKSGQDISKQGFELTSINQTLKSESIMKSNPNISKLFILSSGSIVPEHAFIVSTAVA